MLALSHFASPSSFFTHLIASVSVSPARFAPCCNQYEHPFLRSERRSRAHSLSARSRVPLLFLTKDGFVRSSSTASYRASSTATHSQPPTLADPHSRVPRSRMVHLRHPVRISSPTLFPAAQLTRSLLDQTGRTTAMREESGGVSEADTVACVCGDIRRERVSLRIVLDELVWGLERLIGMGTGI